MLKSTKPARYETQKGEIRGAFQEMIFAAGASSRSADRSIRHEAAAASASDHVLRIKRIAFGVNGNTAASIAMTASRFSSNICQRA